MSDLWWAFTDRLAVSGYKLEDLTDNDGLFRLVAEEFCGFTPQQVSELRKQWHSMCREAKNGMMQPECVSQTSVRTSSQNNDTSTHQGIFCTYPTSTVLSRANRFLYNLSGHGVPLASAMVTELPLPRKLTQAFRGRLAFMHKPTGEVELLWKICSPMTLASIKEGQSLENMTDWDTLCPRGIVLYRDDGAAAQFCEKAPVELARQGWCLVAFDVAVGKSRYLEEEEIRLLQHFSMEECFNTLYSDGYDSISVASCNACVIFHPDQMIPRFVVSIYAPNKIRQPNNPTMTPAVEPPAMTSYPMKKGGKLGKELQPTPTTVGIKPNASNTPPKPSSVISLDAINCQKHSGKEVEFWCPEEKRLLCSHCLFYDGYSNSNCLLVAEAVRMEAPGLERWVQNAETFTKEIDSVNNLFRSAERDIDTCEKERKEELCEHFKRVRAKLNVLEEELTSQIESRSEEQRQSLRNSLAEVQATVEKVNRLIGEAAKPLLNYRAGNIDHRNAVALLNVTQSVFDNWRAVNIPMYSVVIGWDRDIFNELEGALQPTLATESEGQVELPEAIDVNYLKN
ncbi:hypothetical protein C3747_28g150 [Trypanosoma cruzi]|uniref:B box-type domain-containing protein n=1 Tax=Trypanosoma cruzi TaxID=5693 RepID=A0A2V2X4F3_TRYCR|nr:hypothetical protein C3747_28g150 [Trypanosoma cruzi]